MSRNIDKQIDWNQFPRDKKGRIIWKESIGLIVDFFYYGEKHTIKILDYGKPTRDYIEISVDEMTPEIVNTQKIRNLAFDNLFYVPNYFYNIGDVVNGVMIVEQLYIQSNEKGNRIKHYRCKCLIDGYEYIVMEKQLRDGRKCPKCVGKVLIVGYNDLATTDPELIKFLLDKEDGYKYTRGSSKRIWVACPHCGYKKLIKVEELVYAGGLSCPRCSDGLSYPNKFAYNVFEQLSEQYQEYNSEYTPDWLGQMRYDNHIVLKDGQEIVVEMDGGFHYNEFGKFAAQNDDVKDALAKEHDVKVIRVNCFYSRITERFELVKTGLIEAIKGYFDLSNVNWDAANEAGISSKLIEAVNYYNQNPFMSNQQIADYFRVRVETIRHYLIVGEQIGLCTYKRHDPNRWKTSTPLLLCDSDSSFIGVFISARHMAEEMADRGFKASSIKWSMSHGKSYKGYTIKQITWEEYERYQKSA